MNENIQEKFLDELEEKIKKNKNEQLKLKIMLVGGTGVGKSSLINKIFGEEVAKVGHSVPETRGINKIEVSDRNLEIYDTEGYEIGQDKQEYFNENVLATIKKNGISVVWYCISAPNSRVTDLDIKIINKIKKQNVTIAVALTQCDVANPNKAKDIKQLLKKDAELESFFISVNYIKKDNLGNLELKKLIEWTTENITDEKIREAFIREQNYNLDLKKKEVEKIINQHTITSIGVGFVPIPFSDAPLLIGNQMGMVARIIDAYGLSSSKYNISSIIANLGIGNLLKIFGKNASQYLIAQITKFIPIAGGLINASVAALITKSFGYATSELCYRMKEDEINGTNTMSKLGDLTEFFMDILKQEVKKNG